MAVLGSGVNGSRIACHFAGVGLEVLLLDIVPKDIAADAKPAARNQVVNDALAAAIKSNPSLFIYKGCCQTNQKQETLPTIMKDIAGYDWVIEVVVERPDIKQSVFTEVGEIPQARYAHHFQHIRWPHSHDDGKAGATISKTFCGTHFFNPPRYLRLFEIIPTPHTDPEVVDFPMHYGDLILWERQINWQGYTGIHCQPGGCIRNDGDYECHGKTAAVGR